MALERAFEICLTSLTNWSDFSPLCTRCQAPPGRPAGLAREFEAATPGRTTEMARAEARKAEAAELPRSGTTTNNLEAFWMPFTANRQFKKAPRMLVARRGHVLLDRRRPEGARRHRRPVVRQCRPRPAARSSRRSPAQVRELDYAPAFQMGHPKVFELAARLVTYMPPGIDHVFFTNSGSESVETGLKIALAYQRVTRRGLALPPDRPRARLSRRQFRRHLGRRHRRQPQACSARC